MTLLFAVSIGPLAHVMIPLLSVRDRESRAGVRPVGRLEVDQPTDRARDGVPAGGVN